MASTSTSSFQKSFKYDVFLSFRGEDTRNNFVSHLYKALEQNGIQTYKDDEKIEKGKTIDTQLMESIEDSRFFIIVFSKDYASSSWCLDELVKIMECRKASEPVFYDVEPTEVRKQSGPVGEGFKKHENKEATGKWRKALNEAGNLAGWESKNTANGDESKLIEIIVDNIFQKICSTGSSVDGNLVGMETRIEALLSSLELDDDDVRMIGIWGMGGGGKTTLATTIFNQICHEFEGSSFVDNVREVSKSSLSGLKELQKQILTDIFSNQNITVSSVSGGKIKMVQMMHRKKVLVVLDDVDCTDQLEALAGDPNWYKPGSRIIITTRDKQVLVAHRVGFINNVTLLSHTEAIRLFNRYAFTKEIPIQGHKELSRQVVEYADGLPLTIKVLGSLLCGQNEPEWKDALERLKTIPLKETMKILELSYDALDDDYKEIFLDVACILKGWRQDDAVIALESCGFHARNGLRVLQQRSLMNISYCGYLEMHDHIEEMGKNIVRRLNPNEPERHSRLWIDDEIKDIMANNMGTEETKCITMGAKKSDSQILMKGFANMKELRFLHVASPFQYVENVSLHLPNALRFLKWNGYPFSSLPKTFQAKNLVGLEMFDSDIVQLWKDGEEKACLKLRFIKLTNLGLTTLDLSVAPNLETLILENCDNLEKNYCSCRMSEKTSPLRHLQLWEATQATKCITLDTRGLNSEIIMNGLSNMKELRFLHVWKSFESPYSNWNLPNALGFDRLKFISSNSKLRKLHLGITPNLETLSVKKCTDMVELHMPAECPKLVNLDLSNLKLRNLHLTIAPNLERISLYKCTDMVKLHMPAECPKLVNLDLYKLKLRTLHLGITPNLETLSLHKCTYMVELRMPADCPKLVNLDLSKLKLTTLHLGITPNLETLRLNNCIDMVELHITPECPKLVTLHLNDNEKLRTLDLGLTPNLESLDLYNSYNLEKITAPAECLKKLLHLDICNCGRFESFEFDIELDSTEVVSLSELHLIAADDTGICDPSNTWPEFQFSCYYKEGPASSFGNLEWLISLGFGARINVDSFSDIICGLQCLRKLTLEGGIPEAPKNLDQLECIEELIFSSTDIRNLPDSICKLKHLKSLELKSCLLLEKLPDDLGRIESLETLIITNCNRLRDIPNNMVSELPEEIGRLECLKELDITGTGICHPPQSIFRVKGSAPVVLVVLAAGCLDVTFAKKDIERCIHFQVIMSKNVETTENVIEDESHFVTKVVDNDLGALAMFAKHFMGGGGLVVLGGRSSRESKSACGEVGGVKKMSSTGPSLWLEVKNVWKVVSSISKKVTDDIQSSVLSIVDDNLKENLHSLLSEALKNTLPHMIIDSIKQSVSNSIEEKLPVFDAQSRRFVTLQQELSKVIKTKLGVSVRNKVHKGMQKVSNKLASVQSIMATNSQHVQDLRLMFKDMVLLLEETEVFKKANAEREK
ncbi:Toll/interleukin-1 receptor domain-containing protein [Tanacetum coccineum]